MTRELIIEGERMDLAPDTNVTLEYVSNAVGDLGKINLSHSYTIKLPKTSRNSRILDAPGLPGHASHRTRRFLSARFIQNGVDLIGPAQAYILQTTPEAYEIALVWNTLESLQALSESDATINDLPDLPVLPWITVQNIFPDYSGATMESTGAFFATYDSGLGHYAMAPELIKTAPHPSMTVRNLMTRILSNAGVPFTMSENAANAIGYKSVLAAPGHKPNGAMERASGSSKYSGVAFDGLIGSGLVFDNYAGTLAVWEDGWDATQGVMTSGQVFFKGDIDEHRVLINLKAPEGLDFSNVSVVIRAATYTQGGTVDQYEDLLIVQFKADGASYYAFADETINVSSWPNYYLVTQGEGPGQWVEFTAYDPSLPLISSNRVHETIDLTKDNRFPLEGNLPDVGQWEFVKACAALYGLVPIIRGNVLHFYDYDGLLDFADAYDWSAKVDQPRDGMPDEVGFTVSGWAQDNAIAWTEDKEDPLPFDPDVHVEVEDATLKASRDWLKLPFAASNGAAAVHYQAKDDGTVESLDIEPRIFSFGLGLNGVQLSFPASMHGEGLKAAFYARVQEIMRRPVAIAANIRLNEIDIATLDLTRPVYLRQFGGYFAITKIQTSDSDLCKVELIKLP